MGNFGQFDSFWIDSDDNEWGLKDGSEGIELWLRDNDGWALITEIPMEVLEEMGFYFDINK